MSFIFTERISHSSVTFGNFEGYLTNLFDGWIFFEIFFVCIVLGWMTRFSTHSGSHSLKTQEDLWKGDRRRFKARMIVSLQSPFCFLCLKPKDFQPTQDKNQWVFSPALTFQLGHTVVQKLQQQANSISLPMNIHNRLFSASFCFFFLRNNHFSLAA